MNQNFLEYLSFPLDQYDYDLVEKTRKELKAQHGEIHTYRVISLRLGEEGTVFSTERNHRLMDALTWYEAKQEEKLHNAVAV